eukprot:CAMPEP_0202941128 /NCGR_PEP_ID=MMETSP1395-20130829/1238_1 /ASSEMBLY_ACC=CAM_ASM_000871 /TAXON_ID=5961 /ORGANISM="Blepharisma japonicum, Strain Stock R1072" /LENGTH=150 /DNA_ID=CAMNT_0049636051 /DNA_START=13 /DNA_END=465 /DNA_ORIENTATION=-
MDRRAFTVKDVSAAEFIAAYAAYLKRTDKIEIPSWGDIVKTGVNRQLAPYDKDWLYVRAAALARKVYLRRHLGINALQKIYGGSKNYGTTPRHFATGSGKIIRYLLAQLEKQGILEVDTEEIEGKHGGRRITKKGQQELDSIAKQISQAA